MNRLPGTCAGCGQRVELRLQGEAEERQFIGRWGDATRDLPTAWCEPDTWDEHVCVKVSA